MCLSQILAYEIPRHSDFPMHSGKSIHIHKHTMSVSFIYMSHLLQPLHGRELADLRQHVGSQRVRHPAATGRRDLRDNLFHRDFLRATIFYVRDRMLLQIIFPARGEEA